MEGDGRPELLIGAPRVDAGGADAGAAFVVFSSRATGEVVPLAGDDVPGLRFDGTPGSRAGLALAGVADVNGDGLGDLAIGAPTFSVNDRLVGAGYVVFGRASAGRSSLTDLGAGGFVVRASSADGFLGLAVAGLGDLTGDGRPDVAFGAPAADRNERPQSGSVYVIAGKPTSEPVDVDAAALRLDGATAGDRLGAAARGAAGPQPRPEAGAGGDRAVRRRAEPRGRRRGDRALRRRHRGRRGRGQPRRARLPDRGRRAAQPPLARGRRSATSTATARRTCWPAARTTTAATARRAARARHT